jgi:hypothetical protein
MEPNVFNQDVVENNVKPPVWKSAINYGLFYAVVSIIITVIFYVTGNMTSKLAQWSGILIMIAAVVLIQLAYRKELGGYMNYGEALVIGLLSMIVASAIAGIFTFVLYKFIDPALIDQMRLFTEQQMYERGVPDSQIDAAMAIATKFQTPLFLFISSLFSGIFMGLILSAIAAIFTKKKSPDAIFD